MTDRLDEFLRSQLRHQTETIRAGDDFWAKAIDRGRRRRRRRRSSTWLGVGVVSAVVIVTGSLAGRSGDDEPQPVGPTVGSPSVSTEVGRDGACPVGEERRVLSIDPKSLVLGCARLPDGRRVVLLDMYRSHGRCLQIVGLDSRARQCGLAPSAYEPPLAKTIAFYGLAQRTKSAPLEVFGVTSADVVTVEVTYTRDGTSHDAPAALIRATDSAALEVARIAEPFGYFVAVLPVGTSHVSAIARGAGGGRLGNAESTPLPWSRWSRSMITGDVVWDGSDRGA